jgi:glycerol-3-phosphate dehydrogenase (NAD(P)+)
MQITVLGAGAWGTAMAIHAARRHPVRLWARDAAQAAAMRAAGANERYLPGQPFPEGLVVDGDLAASLAHGLGTAQEQGLIVLASPLAGLRALVEALPEGACAVWLCKGLEAGTGLLPHEIVARVRPDLAAGVLSGPSFALEVARAQPTALVAASTVAGVAERAVAAFHAEALRVYTSPDPVGVEVGGAVKNVMAIATGVCDGLGLGANARAALITRGLAEMTRLGLALGARADTFMGLSGLGDLVLTATGDLSRNRRVGLELARGASLPQVLQALGHVSEGVYSARTIAERADALGVSMPITRSVVGLLDGALSPAEAVRQLLQRDARAEG